MISANILTFTLFTQLIDFHLLYVPEVSDMKLKSDTNIISPKYGKLFL